MEVCQLHQSHSTRLRQTMRRVRRHLPPDPSVVQRVEYAPPKPLEEVAREKRAYRRELHTVNVGEFPLCEAQAFRPFDCPASIDFCRELWNCCL